MMLLVNTSQNFAYLITLSRKSVLDKHVFFIQQKQTGELFTACDMTYFLLKKKISYMQ